MAVTCGEDEGDDGDDDDGSGQLDVPCDVAEIIATHCGECHGSSPKFGAPMALTKLEHFQDPAISDDSRPTYEVAYERVNASAANRRMPPASVDPLSAAQKATLSAWLEGGAEGASESCDPGTGSDDDDDDDDDAAAPSTGGSGGAHTEPVKYNDPLMKCYEFRAFTNGSLSTPYNAPTTPDIYVAFTFDPPWQGTQYVRSFRSLIDNDAVIHHWLFFQQAGREFQGVLENALGAHPEGQMLAGWAPGGTDLYFDPDVAFEVPGDVSYQLEAHYNNTGLFAQPDASGVELCVTPTPPAHVASLSWVGTDAIFGAEAVGHCAPGTLEDIHLIQAQPHMHTKGTHMKVVLQRASGQEEIIHDKPFDFNYQRGYIMDTIIQPGDQLWTTCTYSEFAVFGKGTYDEMCYFFSIYWPKLSLSSLGVGTVIHGVNSCIDI